MNIARRHIRSEIVEDADDVARVENVRKYCELKFYVEEKNKIIECNFCKDEGKQGVKIFLNFKIDF